MGMLTLVITHRHSGEEFDVDVPDDLSVGKLAESLRKQLNLPSQDKTAALVYRLVLKKGAGSGVLLGENQTLGQAGVSSGDRLDFWGEPRAAANPAKLL